MSYESEGGSIQPSLVKPIETVDKVVENWKLFEELKAKLLNDSDYQGIRTRDGLKKYIKRSGFRKIAVAFGLSDEILSQTRIDREDGSFAWRIEVRVTAPNGRSCIGVGACDSNERRFNHPEHDILSTCHTRAKSRAISDMVAGGVVSAEEMGASEERRSNGGYPLDKEEEDINFTHEIKWSIDGDVTPIPDDSPAYGSFQTRILEGLKREYGIRFEEIVEEDCVVALLCTEIKEEELKGLKTYMAWTLEKVFMAKKEEITVELVERRDTNGGN